MCGLPEAQRSGFSDTLPCDPAGVTTLGYARVSTADQDPALQHNALAAAGAERVWTDTASGARADRPGLTDLLAYARSGDVLTVWKLDRLGRSLPHLLATVEHLAAEGIELRSLTEGIDTTTPGGRLVFHTLAAVAEFERDLGRERTRAGLAAARAARRRDWPAQARRIDPPGDREPRGCGDRQDRDRPHTRRIAFQCLPRSRRGGVIYF